MPVASVSEGQEGATRLRRNEDRIEMKRAAFFLFVMITGSFLAETHPQMAGAICFVIIVALRVMSGKLKGDGPTRR